MLHRSARTSHHQGVADQEFDSLGGRLVDAAGREWRSKHSAWATAEIADRCVRRRRGGGIVDPAGLHVQWVGADELVDWWLSSKPSFETPGSGRPAEGVDDNGRVWSAHIWRCGTDRLIVFEGSC